MGATTLDPGPTDSLRLDYLSVSFHDTQTEAVSRRVAYLDRIAQTAVERVKVREQRGGRFFSSSLTWEEAGVTYRYSLPDDGGINPGSSSLELTGTWFKYVDAETRKAIYLDLAEADGFRQCTRLDAQRTILDPIADASQIYDAVREGLVWIAGYNGFYQLGKQDNMLRAQEGSSVVFGSPKSNCRCITYDKAKEDNWLGVRAVRHEVRRRKEHAKNGFNDLVQLLLAEPEDRETTGEQVLARSVLAKHMTYLDTTRLGKRLAKKEWPANWASDSKAAWFMDEVLNGPVHELTARGRIEKGLEDSVEASATQYGRKISLYALWRLMEAPQDAEDVMEQYFAMCGARLKDEDLEKLVSMVGEERREEASELFGQFRRKAASVLETVSRKTPAN